MSVHFSLILQNSRFIPAACLNFPLQVFLPAQQMVFIASYRIDLFLKDIDFPFQLSPEHPGICKLGTFFFYLLVKLLYFRLYLFILFFDMLIFGCCFLQIAGCNFIFFLHACQLILKSGIFQKEYIHIQILQLFFFLQIDSCLFRLLFQRLHLFFQFGQDIADTQ